MAANVVRMMEMMTAPGTRSVVKKPRNARPRTDMRATPLVEKVAIEFVTAAKLTGLADAQD